MAKFSDARVAALVMGSAQFRTVTFPGTEQGADGGKVGGIKVAVRCLSEQELDGCRIEAQSQVRRLAKRRSWDVESTINVDPEFHTRLIERSILARAFFDADTTTGDSPEPFFTGEEDVARLSSVQHQRLIQLYLEHQEWVSPRTSLDAEEVKGLVQQMGKGPTEAVALTAFDRDTLVRLCISLAHAAHSTSQIGK